MSRAQYFRVLSAQPPPHSISHPRDNDVISVTSSHDTRGAIRIAVPAEQQQQQQQHTLGRPRFRSPVPHARHVACSLGAGVLLPSVLRRDPVITRWWPLRLENLLHRRSSGDVLSTRSSGGEAKNHL